MAAGHIRRRGQSWEIRYSRGKDGAGKWRTATATVRGTKTDAERELRRLLHARDTGTHVDPNRITVAQYLERWLEHMKSQVSLKSHERYAELARKNIVPLLGAVLLPKLKPVQISDAYAKALTSGRRKGGGGLSARTVHNMHIVLKGALTQAVKWELLGRNPAAAVDAPKFDRATMQTYDLAQTAELLEAMSGKRMFVPTVLAILCGLRLGEIAALRWRSLDLAGAQLAVAQSAEQTKAGIRYKAPKSGRARTVALSATVVSELKAHRIRQAEELLRLGKRLSDDDFVVAQADGSALQPHSIGQEWVRFLAGSTLPRIRFHDLRHSAATHMLASNVHPKIASERLGHSKIGITLDLYSHVLPNMQADAAAIVDDALQAAVMKRQKRTPG